jgi:hypothetical protein
MFLNGILGGSAGNPARAAYLGSKHLAPEFEPDVSNFVLIHNPSDGPLRDAWETFRDIVGVTTPAAKQLARILVDVQVDRRTLEIVAHSQGGAMLTSAIRYAHRQSNQSLTSIRASFHGGANNILVTNAVLARAGVARFGGVRGSGYRNHPFDLVPQVIGLNGVLNPVKLVGSLLMAPRLGQGEDRSPHTLPYVPESR